MTASPAAVTINHERSELATAREELRRLKVVEYHRKHSDLKTLASLTDAWQEFGHKALHELHASISAEPKPTVTELLSHLRIPPEHLHCECDDV